MLTKEELIQYIHDYAYTLCLAARRPNDSLYTIFVDYMIYYGRFSDANFDYYSNMRTAYAIYCFFKDFSIVEDLLLNRDDFLSNEDLSEIKSIDNISSKKIIKLIRNAFNHNDSIDFDRFKISKNFERVIIEFKDLRTNKEIAAGLPEKPFRYDFSIDDILQIKEVIENERQTQVFLSYDIPENLDIFSDDLINELSKIKFIHYYFNKKLDKLIIQSFDSLSDTRNLTSKELMDRSTQLNALATNVGVFNKYELNEIQREKIAYDLKFYKRKNVNLVNHDINGLMYYFLNKVIPVPVLKSKLFIDQMYLSLYFMEDKNISLSDLYTSITKNIGNNENNEFTIPFYNRTSDIITFARELIDADFIQSYPLIIYIDSVITQYCSDDEITIDGQVYNKEKIRNSFAHCRWFVSDKQEIVLYDADPRNIKDYDLDFIGKIKIKSFNNWAKEYMEKNKKSKVKRKIK